MATLIFHPHWRRTLDGLVASASRERSSSLLMTLPARVDAAVVADQILRYAAANGHDIQAVTDVTGVRIAVA